MPYNSQKKLNPMKTNPLKAVFLLLLASTGCSLLEVQHNYVPNTPFSSYQNFHWIQGIENPPEAQVDEQLDQLIRSKISQALVNKGFNESLTEKADFLINYQLITQERVAIHQQGTVARHLGYHHPDVLDVDAYSYRVGSLVLDVVDPQSREVVWQGNVQGFVDVHTDPKKQEQRLDKAVGMLLSKFPPNS
jgi:hypothetical protein